MNYLKHKIWKLLRINHSTTVKVYRGYANAKQITVYGQVFHISPLPRKRYRKFFLVNLLALLRLFIVKTYPNAYLKLIWNEKIYHCKSEKDGFFRFEIPLEEPLKPGWHEVKVDLVRRNKKRRPVCGRGFFYAPFLTQYACISDIDDTFLISHSSTIFKRLFVLFTQNAHSRKPFEGVVKHYQLLSIAGTSPKIPNPFFYVSSSEWNLYDYIKDFSKENKLPKGVYLLSQIKTFFELVKTGKNKHKTKFFRIARILEAFPNQRFILLGDDTQEDPNIYAAIVDHFPERVFCVYIRQVKPSKKDFAVERLKEIEQKGISVCYFTSSVKAMEHSVSIGLVSTDEKNKVLQKQMH